MLLRLLKTNRKTGYFLFPLFLMGIWFNHLLNPLICPVAEGEKRSVFFGLIDSLLSGNILLNSTLAMVLLMISGWLIFRIHREYLFPNPWSFLPSILFVFLASGIEQFQLLLPVWFAVPFLLVAIKRLFAAYDIRKPYDLMFNAGFLLSLGSLFFLNTLILLPAFLIGSQLLARDARWRESALLFLGALMPWIITFSVFYLINKTDELLCSFHLNFLIARGNISENFYLMIYLCLLGLLTLAGSYKIIRQFVEKKVSFRKYFTFFFLLFISVVLSFIFIPSFDKEMFIIAAVPVTFLLSNYLESLKNHALGEILFLLVFSMALCMQFIQP